MATKEEIKQETQRELAIAIDNMRASLGKTYDENKDQLAYYLENLAYLKIVLAMGSKDKNAKKDMEYLLIGLDSKINSLTYKTTEEGLAIFKELFATATKIIISSAIGKLA